MPTATRPIRVVVVEARAAVREGVIATLAGADDIEVVGASGRGAGVVEQLSSTSADVAMVAASLPDADGNEVCRDIRERAPGVGVIVLSDVRREAALLAAFGRGARGFLVAGVDVPTVREAVRAVADGGTFVDPQVADKLVALAMRGRRSSGPYGLTPQQLRVLERLPRGMTYREIGEELGISHETVRSHVRQVIRKLGASDRAEAAAVAVRQGIVEP